MNSLERALAVESIFDCWEIYCGHLQGLRPQVSNVVPFENLLEMVLVGSGVNPENVHILLLAKRKHIMHTLGQKLDGVQAIVESSVDYDVRYAAFVLASLYPVNEVVALSAADIKRAYVIAAVQLGSMPWVTVMSFLDASVDGELALNLIAGKP
jgi:protein-disulfide isomerase-like protein with CxxC motif